MNAESHKAEAEILAEDRGTALLVLIILSVLMLFAGMVYIDRYGGGFSPLVYAPYQDLQEVAHSHPITGDNDIPRGFAVYGINCQPCHQPNGMGSPAGPWPPLAGSEWVNEKNPARLIRIPQMGLVGPITVKGQEWNLSMPNQGAALSDEEMAAVLSYVRQAWGNKAPKVTIEQVKKVRQEISNHPNPFTQDELKAVPVPFE